MRIGVVGAGRIGGMVGVQLGRRGHEVLFSFSRDPGKLQRLARDAGQGRVGTPRDAVAFAEALILAVPWTTIPTVLADLGSLDGKVVIDTTNQFGRGGVASLPAGLTAAQVNAERMPGAALAKAFNTLTAGYQRDVMTGRHGEVAMFFAAEMPSAIETAAALIADCGFVGVHLGGWDRVGLMEAPRRAGAVYGEAYRPWDARRIAGAPLAEAARWADELKLVS
jgi:8-hydroxy-5-deazaflavin:NADPH oxidoreductase